MMGVAARYLRDKAVVALSDGRVARVHDGKILHNGTAPYGYDFNDDETGYVAHLVEAPWVTRMFERYADGWSPNRIAAWLNTEPGAPKPRRAEQWGRPSVNGILQREDYTGTGPRLGWERPTDEHGRPLTKRKTRTGDGIVMLSFPELIPPELWRQSLAMRKEASHHTSYGKTDPDAALFKGTGRVICAGCGKPMGAVERAGRTRGSIGAGDPGASTAPRFADSRLMTWPCARSTTSLWMKHGLRPGMKRRWKPAARLTRRSTWPRRRSRR
jgi:hypothetical protein